MEYEFSEDTLGMVYETLSNIEVAIFEECYSAFQRSIIQKGLNSYPRGAFMGCLAFFACQ